MTPTLINLRALRPDDATIPATDTAAAALVHAVSKLDALLRLQGLDDTSPGQWAALWCADPADTFGMLDDWRDRLTLDPEPLEEVRRAISKLMRGPDLVEALATKFAECIRTELRHVDFCEAVKLNAEDPEALSGAICHTHDYCDANQCMLDAEAFLGIEHDAASQANVDLINAAWQLAKSRGFGGKDSAAGYAAFLAAFPQTRTSYGTGGGCTAFFIAHGAGYILLTDDNLCAPTPADSVLSVGSYDAEGASVNDAPDLLSWDEAIAWVRAELAKPPEELAPLDCLTEAFEAWATANKFPHMCADDLRHDIRAGKRSATARQYAWLTAFGRIWDHTNR